MLFVETFPSLSVARSSMLAVFVAVVLVQPYSFNSQVQA
jgi:hypothetical protein